MSIPFFEYGSSGTPLHFLHANGYPPTCYQPLLELLKSNYHVFGMYLRPLWDDAKPEEIKDWQPFTDDLLDFLASTAVSTPPLSAKPKPDPVIGVGHSIGGTVTLRTALRDPEKFRALVLFDPVIFVPSFMTLWQIIRTIGLGDRLHPLIQGAKKRRRTFDNLETLFNGYRKRPIFHYMSDDSLRAYIAGITKPKPDSGYELVYSPEWEAQVYRTSMQDYDIWRDLPKLDVPTLIIRGAETDTFREDAARLMKQRQPKLKIETLKQSTHLLPLEYPQEVFEMMQSFLQSLESGNLLPLKRQQVSATAPRDAG